MNESAQIAITAIASSIGTSSLFIWALKHQIDERIKQSETIKELKSDLKKIENSYINLISVDINGIRTDFAEFKAEFKANMNHLMNQRRDGL